MHVSIIKLTSSHYENFQANKYPDSALLTQIQIRTFSDAHGQPRVDDGTSAYYEQAE